MDIRQRAAADAARTARACQGSAPTGSHQDALEANAWAASIGVTRSEIEAERARQVQDERARDSR